MGLQVVVFVSSLLIYGVLLISILSQGVMSWYPSNAQYNRRIEYRYRPQNDIYLFNGKREGCYDEVSKLRVCSHKNQILVTGLDDSDSSNMELLHLLHLQNWSNIAIESSNGAKIMKKLISRRSKYSGLQDIVKIVNYSLVEKLRSKDQLISSTLTSRENSISAWLAMNVSVDDLPNLISLARETNLSRLVCTCQMDRNNNFSIPFDSNITADNSLSVIVVYHGKLLLDSGTSKELPYEICDLPVECMNTDISEAILMQSLSAILDQEIASINSTREPIRHIAIKNSDEFAGSYLRVLRESGLNRSEEVRTLMNGGLQRMRTRINASKSRLRKESAKVYPVANISDEAPCKSIPSDLDESILARAELLMFEIWQKRETNPNNATSWNEFRSRNLNYAISRAKNDFDEEARQILDEKSDSIKSKFVKKIASKATFVNRFRFNETLRKLQRKHNRPHMGSDELFAIWAKYLYLLLELTCQKNVTLGDELDLDGRYFALNHSNFMSIETGNLFTWTTSAALADMGKFTIALRRTQYWLFTRYLYTNETNSISDQFVSLFPDADLIALLLSRIASSPLGQNLEIDQNEPEIARKLQEKYALLLVRVPVLTGATKVLHRWIMSTRAKEDNAATKVASDIDEGTIPICPLTLQSFLKTKLCT